MVRRNKKGEVVKVKHVALGWISPGALYWLGKLHDVQPTVNEFIRGGYRIKAQLMTTTLKLFDVPFPIGAVLYGAAAIAARNAYARGDTMGAAKLLAAITLPYGDFYLLYRVIDALPIPFPLSAIFPEGRPL